MGIPSATDAGWAVAWQHIDYVGNNVQETEMGRVILMVDLLAGILNAVYASGCTAAVVLLLWFFLVDDK